MDVMEKSLEKHKQWKGKIEVVSTVEVDSPEALTLAYTPGVARPCLEIEKDVEKSYELTRRHNLCAVVTDGTAVLGLGDIGPEAGMPVMEGKCVLFKSFGNVDAFPICIKSKDVDEIVGAAVVFHLDQAGKDLEHLIEDLNDPAQRAFQVVEETEDGGVQDALDDGAHGVAHPAAYFVPKISKQDIFPLSQPISSRLRLMQT